MAGNGVSVLCVLTAYTVWGLLPVYWKLLDGVEPSEILMHRILWACVLSWAALALFRRGTFGRLRERRALAITGVSALLIGINWHIYVSAVAAGRIVEASFGYYITPLVSIVLGLVFLGERMSRAQIAATVMAAAAVLYLAIARERFPWISLGLALTFGLYGLAKKSSPLDSVTGFALESLFLLPFASAYVIALAAAGRGHFGADPARSALLVGAGVVTAVPLWLFAEGVPRMALRSVGFLQYLLPTLMLLVATVVYGEPFDRSRSVAFAVIWLALIVYSTTLIRRPDRGQARGRGPAREAISPGRSQPPP